MQRNLLSCLILLAVSNTGTAAQQPVQPVSSQTPPSQIWTWENVKERFELNNTTLMAGKLNIDELKAEEITAHLRPNTDFTLSADGTQVVPSRGVWQPFAGTFVSPGISQLFERQHKRGLRYESAKQGTAIGVAQESDTERTLLFNVRSAFVGVLQAKAVLQLAQNNLEYYDKILKISRDRFEAGDIAQIDLDRLELQRLQYESDLQNALVNLRTTKIQMLMLLNDRTPIEQFDVVGAFDFSEQMETLDAYRQMALDNRPDLKAAVETAEQAKTSYKLA